MCNLLYLYIMDIMEWVPLQLYVFSRLYCFPCFLEFAVESGGWYFLPRIRSELGACVSRRCRRATAEAVHEHDGSLCRSSAEESNEGYYRNGHPELLQSSDGLFKFVYQQVYDNPARCVQIRIR